MHRLRRQTVLRHQACDLTALPLTAVEGFLLTLIDGRLTLGEIAEVHGITLAELFPRADRLLALGAVSVVGGAHQRQGASPPDTSREEARAGDKDVPGAAPAPRASTPPAAGRGPGPRRDSRGLAGVRRRTAPAMPVAPGAPPATQADRPSPEPPRAPPLRRASRSARATRAPVDVPDPGHAAERVATPTPDPPPAPASSPTAADAPVLDPSTRARIESFAERLATVDHYALLGVERGAEKAAIKRAYFALAAEFHPDRHFTKQLGDTKATLHRIFLQLTIAHDTLVHRARRAEYDAAHPAPAPVPAAAPSTAPPPPAPRRRSTRKLRAVRPVTTPPPPPIIAPPPLPSAPPDAGSPAAAPLGARPGASTPPRSTSAPPPAGFALFRMYRNAQQDSVRRRVAVFVDAAEDALRRDDPIAAANQYRLALQNSEDPLLRAKLDAVEGASRERLHARHVTRAQQAERGERWVEAATYYGMANEVRPDPWMAERAAHALRLGGGDLRRAVELAEQAVRGAPESAALRITLGEVCLAASMAKRAVAEAERALTMDPGNARAKALADAAARKA